jgi:thioredoxin reductase (NADPH)
MGLIRNAVKQGTEAVDAIAAANKGDGADDMLDLMIVGAGPAGIAARLRAMELGLRFETVEQNSLGGTVAHFPRNKLIMTAPVKLPLYGELRFREIRKEALLGIWQDVIEQTGLRIRCSERVAEITPAGVGFTIQTVHGAYRARRVLLAIGRRGTPRKLGVPGEERSNVVYRLIDPPNMPGGACWWSAAATARSRRPSRWRTSPGPTSPRPIAGKHSIGREDKIATRSRPRWPTTG